MRKIKAALALAAALFAGLAAVAAHAQTAAPAQAEGYPTRPVTIIVPFAPGGSTDVLARVLANKLTKAWGQQVVVDNRTGAGGNVGANAVAKASPDGYTLGMGSIGTHAVNASLYASMPYDTVKDFAPITLVAEVGLLLVVHPSVPVNSVEELIAYAKANPGKLNYASGGNGASQHLAMELFKNMTGTEMAHIPYKGSGNAIGDLVGGQVQIMFGDMPLVLPYVQQGRLRALAFAGTKRSAAAPDIPTVDEAGVKSYAASAWYGLFAPASTPAPIVEKVNAAVVKALAEPDTADFLMKQGAEAVGNTPAQFTAFQKREMDKWGKLIKVIGLRNE